MLKLSVTLQNSRCVGLYLTDSRLIEYYSVCFALYSSPAGDYNLHHVCAYVRAWVTQFSLKLLQLHIFGKLLVLMNFYSLQNFFGLVNFGLLLSE